MEKRFPFWVIPFTLFLFISVVFLVLYFNNKLWFFKVLKPDSKVEDRIIKESREDLLDDMSFFLKKDDTDKLKTQEVKVRGEDKKENLNKKLQSEIESRFSKGVDFFKSGQYKYAIESFEDFLRVSKDQNKRNKAYFYIAYAKMFDGIKSKNTDLIDEARGDFIRVYKSIKKEDNLFTKTIIGLAKTSRLLKNYPEKIDDLLKESLLIERDERVKKIVFYEISLYYLYNNDFKKFVMYIERSGNSIREENIVNTILEQPLNSISIVSLIEKGILNFNYFPYLKYRIQEKMFNDAKTMYYNNQKEESLYVFKKILTLFPYEPIIEDTNYFIASIYHKDLEFSKAIYYYDQVLSNQFPDYDAAALFRKGIIYYREGNYNKARECFFNITTDFVSSNYYKPAKDWIKEIDKISNYRKEEGNTNKKVQENKINDNMKNEKDIKENKPKEDDSDINIFDEEDSLFTK